MCKGAFSDVKNLQRWTEMKGEGHSQAEMGKLEA